MTTPAWERLGRHVEQGPAAWCEVPWLWAVAVDCGRATWRLAAVAATCSFPLGLFEMETKVILKLGWVGHFS